MCRISLSVLYPDFKPNSRVLQQRFVITNREPTILCFALHNNLLISHDTLVFCFNWYIHLDVPRFRPDPLLNLLATLVRHEYRIERTIPPLYDGRHRPLQCV